MTNKTKKVSIKERRLITTLWKLNPDQIEAPFNGSAVDMKVQCCVYHDPANSPIWCIRLKDHEGAHLTYTDDEPNKPIIWYDE